MHVNCAASLDGCIGLPGPRRLRLSDAEDLRRVHELRAESDAILVGSGTALADDPKLLVKWDLLGHRGRPPVRVLLDSRLRVPAQAQLFAGDAPTIVFHAPGAQGPKAGADRVPVPTGTNGGLDLRGVLAELERRGLTRLMVEGGSRVISAFLGARLVDELTVFIAPVVVGDPRAPRLFVGTEAADTGLVAKSAGVLGHGALVRWVRG